MAMMMKLRGMRIGPCAAILYSAGNHDDGRGMEIFAFLPEMEGDVLWLVYSCAEAATGIVCNKAGEKRSYLNLILKFCLKR